MSARLAPDLILRNGRFATMAPGEDAASGRAEPTALAALGGRIVALGPDEEIDALRGPGTEVVDLGGRRAIPGIVDSHCHPDSHAIMLAKQHDLGWPGVRSLDDCLAIIDRATREAPADKWFVGYRYDDVKLGAVPTRAMLDRAGNGRPVLVQRTDSHIAYVNSRALEIAGIGDDTPDPPFGRIDRDPETGAITGLMRETAAHIFRNRIAAENTIEDYVAALPKLFERFAALGITSVHNSLTGSKPIAAYQRLAAEGRLTPRVGIIANGFEDGLIEALIAAGIRSGFGDERLRLIGVEWCPDCSTSGRTAAYYEPYLGAPIPGEPRPNTGMLLYDAEDLRARAVAAHEAGLTVMIEGIGDRGIDFALDAVEACLAARPAPDHRIRIEHCCYVTPPIEARMKRLGVLSSSATAFMHDLGDAYIAHRGEAAMERMWPHRSLIDAGIPAAGHSDAPVCDPNPWRAIWSMVTRKTDSGRPIGPGQKITVREAVAAYTRLGAYLGREEGIKGSLAPGMLADVAVLDRDVFALPDDEILGTETLLTVIGGKIVHRRI